MRVLLQGRTARSLETTPGGDQVQIEATAAALRANHGIDAVVSANPAPDLSGYDLVHTFGIVRPQEVWIQTRNARRQGKPVVHSPVFCDVWEFDRRGRGGVAGWCARHVSRNVAEAVKVVARGAISREWSAGSTAVVSRGFSRLQREIAQATDMFLPNSLSEWRRLVDAGLVSDAAPMRVVPNGVDVARLDRNRGVAIPPHLSSYAGCVLCVGRIEGRKNQLALVRALSGLPLTVVLVGRPAANRHGYARAVHRAAETAATATVHILGEVSESDKIALMSLARVHVLPSWMETTGLASLEAAYCGCRLVVTPNGDTTDYFGTHADYCDPASPESIRTATLRAMRKPFDTSLQTMIATDFSWDAAARHTSAAYAAVLGTPRSDTSP